MKLSAAAVLFTLAACRGQPARLVAGLADTVVVNNVHPVRMPMHVFDAAGHALPDTGVRFQWMSGAAVPISDKGVIKCTHARDATLRASLGRLVTPFLVRCRPVRDVLGGGELSLLVGDSSQVLAFAPVDSAGRPVKLFTMGISYDSAIVTIKQWRIHARAPGHASVDVYIGDSWAHWWVGVWEPAQSLEDMRPGDHRAVPVRLAGGEMQRLELPPSPPTFSVTCSLTAIRCAYLDWLCSVRTAMVVSLPRGATTGASRCRARRSLHTIRNTTIRRKRGAG